MKVIVGLGNPGDKYALTRHNVGFWVVDELSRRWDIPCRKEKFQSLIGEGKVGSQKVLLCKPTTFMNLSGQALASILSFYSELDPREDVIAIYDDMDFAPGHLRLREKGSAGGHNGVKSLIQHLGTEEFHRIRVGIGRPSPERTVIDHVLTTFSKDDLTRVKDTVDKAADAVECVLSNSFHLAMNRFNTKA